MGDIWYMARPLSGRIEPVQVDRHTQTSVWVGGVRRAQIAANRSYFISWEHAHAYLLETAGEDLRQARRRLERAQSVYGNIKGMKPPSPIAEESA